MPLEVIMPALGMAQESGLIVSWQKLPGDAVAEGDVLFEVETDKATMEVEAQGAGFLTQVTAFAGAEVPVGNVIAVISETADAVGPPTTPPAVDAALPEGHSVIMPVLGMAQDTGLLVAWTKAPGDEVHADDVLFEVETDKSTMEVNAGVDGFVAALLAVAGEEVPVGQTIAIITADKPEKTVSRSAGAAAMSPTSTDQSAPVAKPASVAKPHATSKTPMALAPLAPQPAAVAVHDGDRILASPKARRLALKQGLDLSKLVAAGFTQPFHAKDLDALKSLPKAAPEATVTASRHLTAHTKADGFAEFATWAADTANLRDQSALLAGFVVASPGSPIVVAVERFGQCQSYASDGSLGKTTPTDASPSVRVRDLRFSAISAVRMGAEDLPVLTVTRAGDGLAITLECAPDQMSAPAAITLLSNFAARMEQPLRHLL
jgi:pyruvate/2-oxoglutarate dehydrogenase complex dihydrolipoamide acyltransferase (E2) component